MAPIKLEHVQYKIPGGRSGSAPVDIAQSKEEGNLRVLNRDGNSSVLWADENSGALPFASRAQSVPHSTRTDNPNMTTPEDLAFSFSPATIIDLNRKFSTSQPAIVKVEPDGFEAVPTESVPGPATETTAPDGAAKAEQASVISAANGFSQAPREITFKGLRGVADSMDLNKLECGVAAAQQVLDQLRTPLQDFKQHQELHDWLGLIDNLKVKAEKAGRTVIAVAGGTGAGKSSLINAVLDEDKLLPTNGMRACTAVITEVSWNEVDDPQQAYRAEIEFVSPEEWDSELKLMYSELLDDNGHLNPSWRDKTTEAGIAYDKVEALYPRLTQETIMKSNPRDLVEDEAVAGFLGTKKKFSYSSAHALHSNLSQIIDSKEKVGSKQKKVMALWPVIRVVKIFVRANALSTGVVLVDLPGTADSNAARSAVANKYMAECTSVWVVARITRAVDDKEAKNLLGRSSRIQMKLDGAYSHLTFVATQTDGIDIQETIDSVDGDGQIQATYAREQQLTTMIEDLKHRSRRLDKEADDLNEECDVLDSVLKLWLILQKKQKKGLQVYAPPAPSQRPRQTKRRRKARQQVLDDNSGSDNESDKAPLTQEEISAKIKELQTSFDAKGIECESIEKQVEAAQSDLQSLEQQKADIAGERVSLCVKKRNNYCRDAIRQDFAAGIREIDEEDDAADEENYDPSVQRRDYDEVARSLNVFCISSKAYQQLRKTNPSGKADADGFMNLEDTEIPRLQQHAVMSARAGQIRSNKVYLNQFSQVINSLVVWTASNGLSLQLGQGGDIGPMSDETKGYEMKFLEIQLEILKKESADLIFQTKTELQAIVREAFGNHSSMATKHAAKQLVQIVSQWGLSEKAGGHGLAFSTYRGICKRGGEKTPSKKARNFNEDVLGPFLQKIATAWEQAFTRSIPAALDKLLATFVAKLRAFHTLISSRPEMKKSKVHTMRILENQIANHEAAMKDTIDNAKAQIQEEQRLASRIFIPEIKSEMQKVYNLCAAEKGAGCFQRMKDRMMDYIKKNKTQIFKKACRKVNKSLENMFQSIADSLFEDCEHIRGTLTSDYKFVLTSSEEIEVNAVVRDHIREVLESAETKFDEILATAEPLSVDSVAEPHVTSSGS
ncbi:hypothetical protein N0V93_005258 [Gnomoniopsis smithogilvyi]|uniref:Nuclear GTPase SLIP-GC n=1 Tax=Gnomoniopsis smithogilvyi TaxID=1191159 RepID=A0A9W9CXW6_9PEZI|nr:hypothetical protein N0V93_005258 [Gnomoniopsis smithogilvyi]